MQRDRHDFGRQASGVAALGFPASDGVDASAHGVGKLGLRHMQLGPNGLHIGYLMVCDATSVGLALFNVDGFLQ